MIDQRGFAVIDVRHNGDISEVFTYCVSHLARADILSQDEPQETIS